MTTEAKQLETQKIDSMSPELASQGKELFEERFTTADLVIIAEAAHYALQNHFDSFAESIYVEVEFLQKLKAKLEVELN